MTTLPSNFSYINFPDIEFLENALRLTNLLLCGFHF